MAIKLIMPKLGLNMVEGELTQWLKKEGDPITKGEIIYIVETDKVANEVEAPEDGVLFKILVDEGEVVPVRKVVGILAKQGEQVNLDEILEEEKGTTPKPATGKKPAEMPSSSSPSVANSGQVLASPLVKRMAAEKGIDLGMVKGSGPGGRIMAEDLEKAAGSGKSQGMTFDIPGKLVPFTHVRKVIAERMVRSANAMAMVTLNSELDVSSLENFRKKKKSEGKDKSDIPSINAIVISLVAKAIKEFPYLNASFTEQGIRLHDVVNIGLAVDTAEGLLVVVVHDADSKTVREIQTELTQLVDRAQNHKSTQEDMSGSTFTVTNLGMYGVNSFNSIINPPEAGILGICRFVEKDVIIEGKSQRKHVANFSLTFDHRLIDGAPAARFLQRLGELISKFT